MMGAGIVNPVVPGAVSVQVVVAGTTVGTTDAALPFRLNTTCDRVKTQNARASHAPGRNRRMLVCNPRIAAPPTNMLTPTRLPSLSNADRSIATRAVPREDGRPLVRAVQVCREPKQ